MIAQPEVWLRVDPRSAQPIQFNKAIKKALLNAALRYEFFPGETSRSEAEAQIKVPFRDSTTFRCSTDVASTGNVAFSSYVEEDPVRMKRTQWTPSNEGVLRCEISGRGQMTTGSSLKIPNGIETPVLNPLLLLPALGYSRRAGTKSYGAYFVAGRRLYAAFLQRPNQSEPTYTLSICRVPEYANVQWASLDWAGAQRAELDWADNESAPKELRANAPLIGLIRLDLA